jgi:hypothetical protein
MYSLVVTSNPERPVSPKRLHCGTSGSNVIIQTEGSSPIQKSGTFDTLTSKAGLSQYIKGGMSVDCERRRGSRRAPRHQVPK